MRYFFFILNLCTVWIKVISLLKNGLGKLKSFCIPCSVVMTTVWGEKWHPFTIRLLQSAASHFSELSSFLKKKLLMLPLFTLSKSGSASSLAQLYRSLKSLFLTPQNLVAAISKVLLLLSLPLNFLTAFIALKTYQNFHQYTSFSLNHKKCTTSLWKSFRVAMIWKREKRKQDREELFENYQNFILATYNLWWN